MEQNTLSAGLIGIGNMGSAHATMIGSGKIQGLRLVRSATSIRPDSACVWNATPA